MAFQTRAGGNRFTGSAYEYYRNPSFNTNYIFNEINHQGKNDVKLNQFGARLGGPVVIPGLFDGHNKAFFFFHYEQIRFPNSFTRTRTVFNPRVSSGWFRYQLGTGAAAEIREVNVLTFDALQVAQPQPGHDAEEPHVFALPVHALHFLEPLRQVAPFDSRLLRRAPLHRALGHWGELAQLRVVEPSGGPRRFEETEGLSGN